MKPLKFFFIFLAACCTQTYDITVPTIYDDIDENKAKFVRKQSMLLGDICRLNDFIYHLELRETKVPKNLYKELKDLRKQYTELTDNFPGRAAVGVAPVLEPQ